MSQRHASSHPCALLHRDEGRDALPLRATFCPEEERGAAAPDLGVKSFQEVAPWSTSWAARRIRVAVDAGLQGLTAERRRNKMWHAFFVARLLATET